MTVAAGPDHRPPYVEHRRPRRTWAQRVLIALGLLTTLGLVVSAAGLAWGLSRYREIQFLAVPSVSSAPSGTPTNWLLVGSDSREGIDPDDPNAGVFIGEEVAGKRTDTIMVARVDPGARTIDLLSVPRDLWVPIAGTGQNGRINSAFNGDGGEERLVATVEATLGIEINNYAEVNFAGFQSIVDALGGVPVWFETPVRDPASALDVPAAGCHVLDGFDALAYARSRHLEYFADGQWRTDPTGDLGRTARQQYLISRLAATASDQFGVTDVGTVDQVMRVVADNLVLDDGAGAGDLVALARTFAGTGADGIRRHSLPVAGFRTSGGAAVLDLLEAEAEPVLDLFRGVAPPEAAPTAEVVDPASVTVDVLNGARIEGVAGRTATALGDDGFIVGQVGNAVPSEATLVRYPSGQAEEATTVGRALVTEPRYEVDDTLATVTLVIGADYGGVASAEAETRPPDAQPATDAAPATEAPPVTEAPAAAPEADSQVPVQENEVGIVPGPGPAGTACA